MMNRGMRTGGITGGRGLTGGAGLGGRPHSPNGVDQESERIMEQRNEEALGQLHNTVKNLKNVCIDIQTTADEQNSFLDGLMSKMGNANNAVKGTIGKLDDVMKQGGSKHLLILIAFGLFVLISLYYLVKAKSR
eukprot:TRINITY_DN30205_c0_g1_i1.p1 TRINITY_DN30205_c0_g1~~TRINITY_DN30205_c0_g1_i1.p1  ORF type:complete len:134 (+),score=51.84 TRINITY_DN30205_c0_g1_i1:33-434(+)